MREEHVQEHADHEETEPTLIGRLSSGLSRRRLLKFAMGSAALTASTGLLAACGGDDDDDDDDDDTGSGASEDPTATPEPADDSGDEEEEEEEPTEEEEEPDDEMAVGDPSCEVGGTLVYGLSSDPPNLDPHISTGTAAGNVKYQLYTALARYWTGGELEPDLAENWEIADDGLTITFNLRDDVVFHDGTPLTSRDVQVSFERIIDDATGATNQAELLVIDTIDTPDDHTVVLNLAQPSAPLISYLGQIETAILSADFLEAGGDPNTEAVGTGPFTLEERESGVRIVVAKNPDYYHEGYPLLDRIEFVPYADEDTRMAAALGGSELEVAEYVPWKDYETIRNDPNLVLHAGDAAAFMTVMYNVSVPPFDDPAVRYALGFAYDRQAIVDIVFFGEGSPITGGLVPPGLWGHAEHLNGTFEYNPDRARELLAEAGYPDGFDALLLSTSQYGMHQGTAEIVQQNLRDIGVNCELELYDWPTTVEKYSQGDFQFRVHGLGTGGADPDTTLTQYFDSASSAAKNISFQDDEVDRLLAEARAVVDQEERKALYDQVQERILELSPFSFLTYRVQAEVTTADVKGYEHYPGGLGFISCKSLEKTQVGCE